MNPSWRAADVFSSPWLRMAVVVLLGGVMAVVFRSANEVNGATEGGVTMDLPDHVGVFSGIPVEISEGEKFVLPKDTEIVKKSYTDPHGDMIQAQIVLAGAEKRSIHRPELCLPAQGWTINRRRVVPAKLSDGREMKVMLLSMSRPVENGSAAPRTLSSVFCYWFVGKDVTTPSHLMRLLLTSWDRVVHRKNHRWAYIGVSAPVLEGFRAGGKGEAGTEEMVSEFIASMAPSVMKKDSLGAAPSPSRPLHEGALQK